MARWPGATVGEASGAWHLPRLRAEALLPRWRPRAELRPRGTGSPGDGALRITWLGTAAHLVESAGAAVLVDPFFTRPGLARLLRPLVPDEAEIRRRLPARLDAVLCGHSHFDHLLDAPTVARLTGARLVGSRTTCAFGRASGLPEAQLVEIPTGGGALTVGDLTIRFIASRHGRVLGRFLPPPFPGEVTSPPRLPAPAWRYRMGGAFGIHLQAPGASVYHNGSADLIDAELRGLAADVLLVGLAGRGATPDYLRRLVGALSPRLLVPTHHDAFFAPLDEGVRLLPGVDLDGFAAEGRDLGAAVITPAYHERLDIPTGDARAAQLAEPSP